MGPRKDFQFEIINVKKLDKKKFRVQKGFVSNKKNNLGQRKKWVRKNLLVQKKFGSEKSFGPNKPIC